MPSNTQNFRLRRAQNAYFLYLYAFRYQKFSPAAGKKPTHTVLKVFPRIQESAAVIRKTQSETNMRESHCFYGYRNALLPFAKQNRSRAGAIPICFTGVGTRHYHSRHQIGAAHCPGMILEFYGCKNVPLPVAERFISRLSEKPAAGENF